MQALPVGPSVAGGGVGVAAPRPASVSLAELCGWPGRRMGACTTPVRAAQGLQETSVAGPQGPGDLTPWNLLPFHLFFRWCLFHPAEASSVACWGPSAATALLGFLGPVSPTPPRGLQRLLLSAL